jgi:hypothetical protein
MHIKGMASDLMMLCYVVVHMLAVLAGFSIVDMLQ